eukprot:261200-Prorocentrum_minimum.AAC.1
MSSDGGRVWQATLCMGGLTASEEGWPVRSGPNMGIPSAPTPVRQPDSHQEMLVCLVQPNTYCSDRDTNQPNQLSREDSAGGGWKTTRL